MASEPTPLGVGGSKPVGGDPLPEVGASEWVGRLVEFFWAVPWKVPQKNPKWGFFPTALPPRGCVGCSFPPTPLAPELV